jgi:hypothetical protein
VDRLSTEWKPDDDAFVYFNNDHRACALRDARVFALVGRHDGWPGTRIPAADEVRLG